MKALFLLVVCDTSLKIRSATEGVVCSQFAQACCLIEHISKLFASKLNDFEREMMTDTMNMVGDFLRVYMCPTVWFCLDVLILPEQKESIACLPKRYEHLDCADGTVPCTIQ